MQHSKVVHDSLNVSQKFMEQQQMILKTQIWLCQCIICQNTAQIIDTTSLWFYFKYEATNVNANIADNDNFKSFKYKTKLIGNTAAANESLQNATITVPLKNLSNFWRSLKFTLII